MVLTLRLGYEPYQVGYFLKKSDKIAWWIATLPERSGSYSCANRGSYKVNFGTEIKASSSQSGQSYS